LQEQLKALQAQVATPASISRRQVTEALEALQVSPSWSRTRGEDPGCQPGRLYTKRAEDAERHAEVLRRMLTRAEEGTQQLDALPQERSRMA
jgi:ABC-type nitrate/sulfonate/bicarbonate transport system substrate-binding protein